MLHNSSAEVLRNLNCHSVLVSSAELIVIKATATDAVTDEAYSGELHIPIEYSLLKVEFLSITSRTFKEGLTWRGFVS